MENPCVFKGAPNPPPDTLVSLYHATIPTYNLSYDTSSKPNLLPYAHLLPTQSNPSSRNPLVVEQLV